MDRLLNVTTAVSLLLLGIVLFSLRRAHIRVEYSVSWLMAALAMLVLSRSRPLLDIVRNWMRLPDSPLALFLLAGAVAIIKYFPFYIIISHLRDDNVDLEIRISQHGNDLRTNQGNEKYGEEDRRGTGQRDRQAGRGFSAANRAICVGGVGVVGILLGLLAGDARGVPVRRQQAGICAHRGSGSQRLDPGGKTGIDDQLLAQ